MKLPCFALPSIKALENGQCLQICEQDNADILK